MERIYGQAAIWSFAVACPVVDGVRGGDQRRTTGENGLQFIQAGQRFRVLAHQKGEAADHLWHGSAKVASGGFQQGVETVQGKLFRPPTGIAGNARSVYPPQGLDGRRVAFFPRPPDGIGVLFACTVEHAQSQHLRAAASHRRESYSARQIARFRQPRVREHQC